MDHWIPARGPNLESINKKKRIGQLQDFAIQADHRIKLNESKKIENNLDLVRELKKLWNMKVKVIPIVVGCFEMFHKGQNKKL